MNEKLIELQADILRALAHPTRLKILQFLGGDEKCVCEILDELQLEQSNVSQHLAILRQGGLVASRRDGSRVFYKVINPAVLNVLREVTNTVLQSLREMQALLKQPEG